MQLQVLPGERFSCHSCTDCCRRWYVELFDGEPERIEKLAWPAGDPLQGVKGVTRHGGTRYLAHRPDGACVFLNESNGLCRIHEQFGAQAKPISCRIYPFQITPTFAGEASVTARFDCPTVRRNRGNPHADALPEIRKYVEQFPKHAGFDDETCCHLDRDQISAVADFVATLQEGFKRCDERAMFIVFLSDILALTATDQLNRPALAGIFSPLKTQIESAAAPAARPNLFHRAAFRTLLALYLRRDEDILDHRASRIRRVISMTAFVFGFGSFAGLGLHHPPGKLRRANLFKSAPQPTVESFVLFWRLIRNKLESFGFMGEGNGSRNFLSGLRSLALLYPLVLAAARHHAATRDSMTIDATDVDYAVAAIEHSFGRSAVLVHRFLQPIERLLLNRGVYIRLVMTL